MPQSLQHQCLRSAARQGRTGSINRAGTEWRQCYSTPQTWLLCSQISEAEAGQPGAAGIFGFPKSHIITFSPDLLSLPKQTAGSGLSTMALEAAAGQAASASTVPSTNRVHSTLGADPVTRAGSPAFWDEVSVPPASEAPGTFLTAPSSRQEQAARRRQPKHGAL